MFSTLRFLTRGTSVADGANSMKTIDQTACAWQPDMQVVNSCTVRMKPPEGRQTIGSVGSIIKGSGDLVCGSGRNEDGSLTISGPEANRQDSGKDVSNASELATVQTVYRLTHRELSILGIVLVSSDTLECAESGGVVSKSQNTAKKRDMRNDATRLELRMNPQTLVKWAILLAFLTKVLTIML